MRNLKKLFAVIMTVAMLASVMVPALAADSFSYEAEAKKLYDLGLFKGNSTTSYVPDLGTALNRQAGLALTIRLLGKDAEVLAMTEEEVAEQLAKIVDADEINDWAKPYAAYAVKNGLTDGIDATILPNVKFGPQLDLSGKEFINFVLKAMGYRVGWDDVLTKAAEVGMLSASEAVTFGTTAVLNRDMAIGVMSKSLTGTTAAGITLAQALVDAGAVTAEAMAAAGFFAPTTAPTEAPKALEATASTTNNIQINVVYSEAVDKDSATKADNYKLSSGEIDNAELKDDGVTVVLTLKAKKNQEDKVDLTIKDVKSAAGVVIAETTLKDVLFLDKEIPTVVDAQVVGKDTIKVIFSEPMEPASSTTVDSVTTNYLSKDGFVVNGGKLYVKEAKLQKNYTEALVKLYSALPEGEVTIQVKSTAEDFAGFGVIGKLITLNVVKDTEAPVVIGYENAKPTEVTLIWSEDIEFDGTLAVGEWYHTNSNNSVKANGVKVDGNKTTLSFDEAKKLPQGTAYVYVLKEAVKDYWGNKNDQQMVQVEVVLDKTAPEVKEVKQGNDEQSIIVTFNEKMKDDSDSTLKKANYTILDKDGEEQKDLVSGVAFDDADHKKVKLTLSKKLGGDYSLVIKGAKDEAGNEVVEVTMPFTIVDKTEPLFADFKAVVYNRAEKGQMVKVSFGEAMNTEGRYAINDVDNYIIGSKALKDIKNVKIAVVDSGKAVEITIPSVKDSNATDGYDIVLPLNLTVARVADAAGNYTAELQFALAISDSAASPITFTAEATARDVVKVTFEDEVKFEVADFTVTDGVYNLTLAGIETALNDDGKTVATFTLANQLSVLFDDGDAMITVAATPKTENKYGVKVSNATVDVKDKIAPDLYDDGDSNTDKDYITVSDTVYLEATIKFSEAIADVNEYLAGNDLVVKLDGKELVNGTDFNVVAASLDDQDNAITLRFVGKENSAKTKMVLKGNLTIERVASPNHIKDLRGNKLAAFKTIQLDVDLSINK